ncbi:MAG TPA: hypothetical protein VH372_07360 [Actinospica sp.]|nr:hypothetical protein [Actinospica sp.]
MLIRFAGSHDGSALAAYLERLLHFDKTAAVRFVGVGPAAAAYTGPPFGGRPVLALRVLALRPETAPFDVTVLAGKLLEGLSADDAQALVPDTMVGGPSWAGLLPPRTGWTRLGLVSVRELAREAAQGNTDFRFRALGLDRAGLDALGEEIWSRPVEAAGGSDPAEQDADAASRHALLALRTAHAAQALGFLGPDPEQSEEWAPLARIGRWLRLDAPYGTVLQRD